jgi:serine acetyltransferase
MIFPAPVSKGISAGTISEASYPTQTTPSQESTDGFVYGGTIGTDGSGFPRLGGHVEVGAGARILGDVTIGDHALIGANAVVLCDVPAGATKVGVPARVLRHRQAHVLGKVA